MSLLTNKDTRMNSKINIEGYNLKPENRDTAFESYDISNHYCAVHNFAKENSKVEHNSDLNLGENCHNTYVQCMDQEGVISALDLISKNNGLPYNENTHGILSKILNKEVDNEIKNYFKSHYAVMFFAKRTLTSDEAESNIST